MASLLNVHHSLYDTGSVREDWAQNTYIHTQHVCHTWCVTHIGYYNHYTIVNSSVVQQSTESFYIKLNKSPSR